jgi:2-amino-4-hydroxy-6-hydroxymethyldihydropteridine diphosphokinase
VSGVTAYVSGGCNLDTDRNLRIAARALKQSFPGARFSPCYRNKAVGFVGPDFVNFVVALPAAPGIAALKAELERIELLCGRAPGAKRWEPREMDLDIVLYGDVIGEVDGVKLPRPSLLEWGFMLGPLAQIAPQLLHPTAQRTIQSLWAAFDQAANPITVVDLDLAAA